MQKNSVSCNVKESEKTFLDLFLYPDPHKKLIGPIWAQTHAPFKFLINTANRTNDRLPA